MFTLGVDVGSTASKCVILEDGKRIVSKSLVPVGTGTSGPARAIAEVFEACGMEREDMTFSIATGYGRHSIDWTNCSMSELSCHAHGAYFVFPQVKTVIDIGGQDAKVLRVGPRGMLSNFVMNDKCAAGTGRFLDVMARVLEIEVGDMEALGAQARGEVTISSTCTVFAESEVISQLAAGSGKCEIIDGIHRSVASRVSGLVQRIGVEETVVMTGGVARNGGVVRAMEKELGVPIYVSELSQYMGALGAARLAYAKQSER